ncbi:MAG: DUF4342 domain-containing protein [Acidaminobacteraceae bacterium]
MVNITLEMVDEVINRTGATYKEAKDSLEFCSGDVLDAIVYIETIKSGEGKKNEYKDQGSEMIDALKELVRKGHVNRVIFEKDGKVILDIPVLAGALGALIFVGPTVIAIIAAIATGCVIKVEKDTGEIINFNDLTEEKFNEVKEKVNEFTNKKENVSDEDFDNDDADPIDKETTEENVEDEEDVIMESSFIKKDEDNK